MRIKNEYTALPTINLIEDLFLASQIVKIGFIIAKRIKISNEIYYGSIKLVIMDNEY